MAGRATDVFKAMSEEWQILLSSTAWLQCGVAGCESYSAVNECSCSQCATGYRASSGACLPVSMFGNFSTVQLGGQQA